MKNIAILIHALTCGGAERIAGLLSINLSKKYNVYIFLLHSENITYEYAGTIVDLSYAERYEVETAIRENKIKYKIDCAISFLTFMNMYNIRTRCGETVIISHRCSTGEEHLDYLEHENQITRDYYNEADKIVACSFGNAYDLSQYYGIDENIITTIYNYVDKNNIITKSKASLSQEVIDFIGSSKLILNVGRLDPQKNQAMLLEQFKKLVQADYDVKLIILGAGVLENNLKSLAGDLGIADKVRFEVYCANPFPYYKAAHILACSTNYEGLPNVIIEAMTLGLPVVSVDCLSGPRELLKEDSDYSIRTKGFGICSNGILVEKNLTDRTGETDCFASGIKALLDDADLYEKISQHEKYYMSGYDNEKITQAWTVLVENTVPRMNCPILTPLNIINNTNKIIVYGAGLFGKRIMQYIVKEKQDFDFIAYAVSNKMENPTEIDGIPVYQIDELLEHKKDSVVIIGVSGWFEAEVRDILKKHGFRYAYTDLFQ